VELNASWSAARELRALRGIEEQLRATSPSCSGASATSCLAG
jgi:hypothetical protein